MVEVDTKTRDHRGPIPPRFAWFRNLIDPVLFSYSQVLFTRNRWVGLLLLAATLYRPVLGLAGIVSILLSFLVVRLAHFNMENARKGLYGYNPLLTGLAVAAFLEPCTTTLALLVLAVVAVVYVQTAFESALGYFFNLPVLSLPFVVVTFIVLAAVPFLKHAHPATEGITWNPAASTWIPGWLDMYLRSLGAIFFSPDLQAGALVFAGLLFYSRIAVVLSFLGFFMGHFLLVQVFDFTSPFLSLIVGYNFILTAIALGGIWFVPQASSFVFACVGSLMAGLLTAATILLVAPYNLPVLILPFNLTIILLLYAMRQRTRDGSPKAVDFVVGSPEANLNYYRTRVARLGSQKGIRFSLPFSGRWTVTQGVDGQHTHRGLWRYAWDFEVMDAQGVNHNETGTELGHYHCYLLPVHAVADGTVVKVVDDVRDNPVGERNPRNNWGNLVLIQHGLGLYSLVCHLSPGTIEVAEGQFVRRGMLLGRCGNSGRSFVPHLHFQFQATPRVGAPTLEAEFHDVVIQDDQAHPVLHRSIVPSEGLSLRNLVRQAEVASMFAFPIGSRYRFRVTDPNGEERDEDIVSRIDLYNNLYLESLSTGSRLFFENQDNMFLVYDIQGSRRSVLSIMGSAATRIPFEQTPGLTWDDILSRRRFRPRWTSWIVDLVDPFMPAGGLKLAFHADRRNESIEVVGEGVLRSTKITTFARFEPESRPAYLALEIGKRKWTATLVHVEIEEP